MANTKRCKAAQKVLGDDVKVVHRTEGYVTVAGLTKTSHNFYAPSESLANAIQDKIDHEMTRAPVKHIDPKTLNRTPEKLEGIHLKRAIAMKKIKLHRSKHPMLWKMQTALKSHAFALTEKQCDMIISIGKQIEEKELQEKKG